MKHQSWEVSRYSITIQRDDEGKIFDVNISDGYHSISTDDIRRVSDIIKELEN